jgi:hypothetical protein
MSYADSTESISRSSTTISTISRAGTALSSLPIETVLLNYRHSGPSSSGSQDTKPFGILVASSIQERYLGLDWALVELSDDSVTNCRKEILKKLDNVLISGHVASTLERSVVVTSFTGYSGRLMGTISPGFTPMKLSPRSKFQDVWTVKFDLPLSK